MCVCVCVCVCVRGCVSEYVYSVCVCVVSVCIWITCDTFQLEMSPANDECWNMALMSVTAETSQDPIGPCISLEQSKSPPPRH